MVMTVDRFAQHYKSEQTVSRIHQYLAMYVQNLEIVRPTSVRKNLLPVKKEKNDDFAYLNTGNKNETMEWQNIVGKKLPNHVIIVGIIHGRVPRGQSSSWPFPMLKY